jgi:hypothetical protein
MAGWDNQDRKKLLRLDSPEKTDELGQDFQDRRAEINKSNTGITIFDLFFAASSLTKIVEN